MDTGSRRSAYVFGNKQNLRLNLPASDSRTPIGAAFPFPCKIPFSCILFHPCRKEKRSYMRSFIKWFLIIIGIGVLVYPSLSQFLISRNASRAIAHYDGNIAIRDEETINKELNKINIYNDKVTRGELPGNYYSILNPDKTGMMGYVVIPSLGAEIPVFHGTDKSVLTKGVGHVEGTSLPSGGDCVHCVIAGHSGLSTANLFTGLDKVKLGDVFSVKILNKSYNYLIDDIQVVLPDETDTLVPVQGENYTTLITCVPYGVNSHRLLVRGKFVNENENYIEEVIKENKENLSLIDYYYKIPIQYRHLTIGLAIILLIVLIKVIFNVVKKWVKGRKKKKTLC